MTSQSVHCQSFQNALVSFFFVFCIAEILLMCFTAVIGVLTLVSTKPLAAGLADSQLSVTLIVALNLYKGGNLIKFVCL